MTRIRYPLMVMAGSAAIYQLLDITALNHVLKTDDVIMRVACYLLIGELVGYVWSIISPMCLSYFHLGTKIDPDFGKYTKQERNFLTNNLVVGMGVVEGIANILYFLAAMQVSPAVIITFNALVVPLSAFLEVLFGRLDIKRIISPLVLGFSVTVLSIGYFDLTEFFREVITWPVLILVGRVILSVALEFADKHVVKSDDAISLNRKRQMGIFCTSLLAALVLSHFRVVQILSLTVQSPLVILIAFGAMVFSFIAKEIKSSEKRYEKVTPVLLAWNMQVPNGVLFAFFANLIWIGAFNLPMNHWFLLGNMMLIVASVKLLFTSG